MLQKTLTLARIRGSSEQVLDERLRDNGNVDEVGMARGFWHHWLCGFLSSFVEHDSTLIFDYTKPEAVIGKATKWLINTILAIWNCEEGKYHISHISRINH